MQAFVQWLPKASNVQIVLESTGPYWQPLDDRFQIVITMRLYLA